MAISHFHAFSASTWRDVLSKFQMFALDEQKAVQFLLTNAILIVDEMCYKTSIHLELRVHARLYLLHQINVVCRYVSHLLPGGAGWSRWQRAARLHSSRTAGRAAGSSLVLSFLSRTHIHPNTHLLSDTHFSLSKKKIIFFKKTHPRTHRRQKQRLVCQVGSGKKKKKEKNSRATPGRSLNPRDPDSELGRFAPRNLRVKHNDPAPGTGLYRHARSLKGREQIPQWGAATGGDILWALPPPALPFRLLLLHRRVTNRGRQTHPAINRSEPRNLYLSEVWTSAGTRLEARTQIHL